MILGRLLAKGPAKIAARALLDSAVAQSRLPALYEQMGVSDSIEGRFEMLSLHAILLLERLAADRMGATVRQALFDAMMSDLDGALREMGVGDLAVGKRMRALAQAFYGRAQAYHQAFSGPSDGGEIQDVIARTALLGVVGADASAMAGYVGRCRELLLSQSTAALVDGHALWPSA